MGNERISKILSSYGAASRRKAEEMIAAGRVTVNGSPASLGQKAQPGVDEIALDGRPLAEKGELVHIMLNKPRGYVTTVSDERGRKTVMSLVEGAGARLYPVGRLDINSEGLLFMTNDGAFANRVAHPSFNNAKTYEVHVRGGLAAAIPKLRAPMEIDSRTVRAVSVELTKRMGDGGILRIVISEGRNRQIRKTCAMCGLEVLTLKRVAIGAIALGSLKTGEWRRLTDEEIQALMG